MKWYALFGLIVGLLLRPQAAVPLEDFSRMDPALVTRVMDRVLRLGYLDVPAVLPITQLVPAGEFPVVKCPDNPFRNCPVAGLFDFHKPDRVWVRAALADQEVEAVLAHELVHYLQYVRDGNIPEDPYEECLFRVRVEAEAYKIEWAYRNIYLADHIESPRNVVNTCRR